MVDVNRLRLDAELEVDGVWHNLGDGAEFKLARLGNPRFVAEYQKVAGPYREQAQRKTLPPEKQQELMIVAFCRAVLVDWRGLEENGAPLPYSSKKAIELFSQPEFRVLLDRLFALSQDDENYRARTLETDLGKSGHGSGGSGATAG